MAFCKYLFVLAIITKASLAAECHGSPDPNAKENTFPIKDADMKLVAKVKNGKLFTVGDANTALKVVHVWGSPYEMGYAHGSLLKTEAASFMNAVWDYMEDQVVQGINGTGIWKFHEWFLKDVANLGVEVALDLEILVTSKYTGDYFLEEIKGLADACEVDYKKIQRIHMLGELTKGSCSMMGAWGDAVADPIKVLQFRALDWDTDGPFKDYPQLTVYHPSTNGTGPGGMKANAFVNIGFTGWLGSITGMSSAQMAISEIGASFPDETFGKESRFGIPFTYILRDILQFDYTLDDAINRLANARRTCDLIFGVGDGKEDRGFRGVQYSASVSNFYDDQNLKPEADWHPKIKDVVYWGMDWLCPGYNKKVAERINANYGKLSPEIAVRDIMARAQTGSVHSAVYDLTQSQLYVGFARAKGQDGPTYAYQRGFIKLDANMLFNEPMP
uniref:protein dcd1A-like n=1 Tax=Styela clava TaxID=7725 RepID=UPI00193A00F9|nr:protein dcd1A-like [Styela clava]